MNDLSNADYYEINKSIHHYLAVSYAFKLNNEVVLKPSALIKGDNQLKTTADFSLTAIYNNKVWIGISYRSTKTMGVFTQLQIGEKMRLGYAYDFGMAKDYIMNYGSHELVCTFDLQVTKKRYITPRYF
jgi:type IX secretion system PorP/SprF family membrane protein